MSSCLFLSFAGEQKSPPAQTPSERRPAGPIVAAGDALGGGSRAQTPPDRKAGKRSSSEHLERISRIVLTSEKPRACVCESVCECVKKCEQQMRGFPTDLFKYQDLEKEEKSLFLRKLWPGTFSSSA